MPWIKIDDHFDEHPKFATAGPLGMALWMAGMAHCNRNLTDGFIPWSTARTLVSWRWLDGTGQACIYVGSDERVHEDNEVTSEYVIELLLSAGLWLQEPNGYRVHDYAHYQPTRAQVEAERDAKVAAGRAGGRASARARATAPATTNGTAPAVAQSKPVPVPVPVPRSSEEALSSAREDCVDLYYTLTVRPPSVGAIEWLDRLASQHGPTLVSEQMTTAWTADPNPRDFLSRVEAGCISESRKRQKAADKSERDTLARLKAEQDKAMPPERQEANLARLKDALSERGLI